MRKTFILFLVLVAQLINADADWYKTQIGTGIGNCGPASVSMAIGWSTKKNISVEEVRDFIGYTRDDGSTDILELISALRHYKADNELEMVESLTGLKNLVKLPDVIVIVLVDTAFIDFTTNPKSPFGKIYPFEGGHYIVLTDVVSNYFVVQDPWGGEDIWSGKDRKYHVDQIWKAMKDKRVILIRNYDVKRN